MQRPYIVSKILGIIALIGFTIAPYLVRYGPEFLDAALKEAKAYVSRAVER